MKEAVSITTDFDGSHGDPGRALRLLAENGVRHIMWCHEWNTDHLYSDRELAYLAGLLKQTGVRLLDIHGSDGGASGEISSWYSPCETYRESGVELVRNRLRMMAMLHGEGSLVMHVPFLRDTFTKEQIEGDYGANRKFDALRRSLDTLVPECQALGVPLALENMPEDNWVFLETILKEYPADVVGLCYDSGHGNISWSETPPIGLEKIEAHKERLFALHLHDNDGHGDQHQPPFFGTIDWERLIRIVDASPSCVRPLNFELSYREPSGKGVTVEAWLRDAVERCRKVAALSTISQ